jgi:hypothetical protein
MLVSNIILLNMNIMNMKMHMLICLFISMLVGKERNEIVIKIRDIYLLGKEWNSSKDKR